MAEIYQNIFLQLKSGFVAMAFIAPISIVTFIIIFKIKNKGDK